MMSPETQPPAFGNEPPDAARALAVALRRWDDLAVSHQRRRLTFAAFASLLGPFACAALATNTLFIEDGDAAIAVASLELVALGTALALGFLSIGQSHSRWIDARFRAEVLRRESWLLATRSGPYIRTTGASLARQVQSRIDHVTAPEILVASLLPADEALGPGDLQPTRSESCVGAVAFDSIDSLRAVVRRYRVERLEGQLRYLREMAERHHRAARGWEGAARLVLVAALVISAVHLGSIAGAKESSPPGILDFLGLFLPALGATLVGLHSVLGSHRLARSYQHTANELSPWLERVRHVEDDLAASGIELADKLAVFQRLVATTEQILSQDLLRWHFAMEPEAPRAAA